MKTENELNTLKNELETLSKKLAELTEEELEQVAGGTMDIIGLGIQWDDYRCLKAVDRCRVFRERFKQCDLFSPSDKERVFALCDKFCMYMSETFFDLNLAKDCFIGISAILTHNSMTLACKSAWGTFVLEFNSILE